MNNLHFEDTASFDLESLNYFYDSAKSNEDISQYSNYEDNDYFIIVHNKEDTWRHCTKDNAIINGGVGIQSLLTYISDQNFLNIPIFNNTEGC